MQLEYAYAIGVNEYWNEVIEYSNEVISTQMIFLHIVYKILAMVPSVT